MTKHHVGLLTQMSLVLYIVGWGTYCTHIKSRVEVTPEVELFQNILDNTRKFYMVVNGTIVALPSLMESHMPKRLLLVLLLLYTSTNFSLCV